MEDQFEKNKPENELDRTSVMARAVVQELGKNGISEESMRVDTENPHRAFFEFDYQGRSIHVVNEYATELLKIKKIGISSAYGGPRNIPLNEAVQDLLGKIERFYTGK